MTRSMAGRWYDIRWSGRGLGLAEQPRDLGLAEQPRDLGAEEQVVVRPEHLLAEASAVAQVLGTVGATADDELFSSTGLAHQAFPLTFTSFLDGSTEITAGNGAFSEVESFLDSGPGDQHFVVLVDQNDRATVRFGDGLQGAIPTGTIRVRYKTGGGHRATSTTSASWCSRAASPTRLETRSRCRSRTPRQRAAVCRARAWPRPGSCS